MAMIAIIPARGGGKRIPGKNTRPFHGKPILGYAVEAARESGLFDAVMVSTDCASIASVAEELGAEVPFLRSEQAAGDTATMAQAIIETLQRLAADGRHFQQVCCLFATAPFVTAHWIRQGHELLQARSCDSVVSVQRTSFPIMRSLQESQDGFLEMVWAEHLRTRSQDLQHTCHDAAQLYWANTAALLDQGTFYTRRAAALYIGEFDAHDIDTPDDWQLAERLWSFNQSMRLAS